MIRAIKNLTLMLLLVGVVVTSSGCFALLLGAAAGAGGVAYVKGSAEKNLDKPVDQVYRASLAALKKLKMAVHDDDLSQHVAHISAVDNDGKKIQVDIEALTEKTAKLKVRVGVFGDQERSSIILNMIQKRL